MHPIPPRFDPATIEAESRALWASRSLPPAGGSVGPAGGARVHQFLGALSPSQGLLSFLQRAVRADVEARYLALTGRRSMAPLLARCEPGDPFLADAASELRRLSVWPGAFEVAPSTADAGTDRIQLLVERLAARGILVRREAPVRVCPSCGIPRPPPALVHVEEEALVHLVRFPLVGAEDGAALLVWTDLAWKLLGTAAVLVEPKLAYVRIRYTRRGTSEVLILSRGALGRLTHWLEGATWEVLEELTGANLVGRRYRHPLATEFPALADLPAPAGTIVASEGVEDRGSGIVALVPAHGGNDAAIAAALGIEAWSAVDSSGELTRSLRHKYAGLPEESGESFILRDLADSGLLFASLPMPRGVPHCAVCGSRLRWQPGAIWCLVPSKLSDRTLEEARRRLPGLVVPPADAPVPWPITELGSTQETTAPRLRECPKCGRLAPAGVEGRCDCGGNPVVIRRRLLPSFREALLLADRSVPFSPQESIHIFLPERRCGPALLQCLAGIEAAELGWGSLAITRHPSLPKEAMVRSPCADADRIALLADGEAPRSGDRSVAGRRAQAARRLRQFWQVAHEVLQAMAAAGYQPPTSPIGSALAQLPEEDRAFLARFERTRLESIRALDAGDAAAARGRLIRFFDVDLRGAYLPNVRPRLAQAGLPAEKLTALRVLAHVIPTWAELGAPLAPHTMEAIDHAFRGAPESLFERRITPVQEAALDPRLEQGFETWHALAATLRAFRRELGSPPKAPWPTVVVVARDEATAALLRDSLAPLARVAQVQQLEVASPERPWEGRELRAKPLIEELQRAYGSQAARIARILEGMPPRRIQAGLAAGRLELTVDGVPRPILPTMVSFTDRLPAEFVTVHWPWGELLVRLPAGGSEAERPPVPTLSPDGFRILHAIRRRIARSSTPSAVDRVVVATSGALGEELLRESAQIGAALDGITLEVTADAGEFRSEETSVGRTGRGSPWSVWIPGLAVPRRPPKARPAGRRGARSIVQGRASVERREPEFLAPELLAKEAGIRAIVDASDPEFGRPVLGPAKVAAAWDAGLHDLAAIGSAPYEALEALPGFGPALAAEIVHHFGGSVPVRERAPAEPTRSTGTLAPAGGADAIVDGSPADPAPVVGVAIPPDGGTEPPGPPPVVVAPAAPPVLPTPIVAPPRPPPPAVTPRPPALTSPGAVGPVPPPAAPPSVPPPPVPRSEAPAGVELWPGPTADPAWREFLEATGTGHRGLCVSREFPDRLRAFLGPRDVEVVWLSNAGRAGSLRPGDLAAVQDLFRGALEERGAAAIYLDGVEYLIRLHTLERTLEFLAELDRSARLRKARVWVPVNPALLDPTTTDRLSQSLPVHLDAAGTGAG